MNDKFKEPKLLHSLFCIDVKDMEHHQFNDSCANGYMPARDVSIYGYYREREREKFFVDRLASCLVELIDKRKLKRFGRPEFLEDCWLTAAPAWTGKDLAGMEVSHSRKLLDMVSGSSCSTWKP